MRDPSGISRGSGFVAFSRSEEGSRGLAEMNGKMVGSKPLYVTLAQRKEDRRARLQAQFSQMRPVPMPPNVGPCVTMYPPGAPGWNWTAVILWSGSTCPNSTTAWIWLPAAACSWYETWYSFYTIFFVPMAQQGQQAQHPGGRRTGEGSMQQTQHPMPLLQQQMFPRGGRVYRYPPGQNMPEVPIPGVGGMLSAPYDMGGMLLCDAYISQPLPIGALAPALANASPEQQRTMLGESLHPLVEQLERDHAAKVTGMLLEMDQTEVLHLLESPDALKAKVVEAMEVLRNVAQQQQPTNVPTDQLAVLSLNDGI